MSLAKNGCLTLVKVGRMASIYFIMFQIIKKPYLKDHMTMIFINDRASMHALSLKSMALTLLLQKYPFSSVEILLLVSPVEAIASNHT